MTLVVRVMMVLGALRTVTYIKLGYFRLMLGIQSI